MFNHLQNGSEQKFFTIKNGKKSQLYKVGQLMRLIEKQFLT